MTYTHNLIYITLTNYTNKRTKPNIITFPSKTTQLTPNKNTRTYQKQRKPPKTGSAYRPRPKQTNPKKIQRLPTHNHKYQKTNTPKLHKTLKLYNKPKLHNKPHQIRKPKTNNMHKHAHKPNNPLIPSNIAQ